jgi:hypothetical protein
MENIDIWRAAQQLIREHEGAAEMHAAMRLDQAARENNAGGEEMWRAVLNAVRVLIHKDSGPGKKFN